jgi:ribonuclease P/MRP protein subunit POP5
LKRVKRRYLALQIEFDGALSERDFLDTVWAGIARLYGEYGASQTGLALLHFDEEQKTAMIRVSLVALQQVRAALVSITRISGKAAAVHVKSVSGTIKSLRDKKVA